MADIEYKTDIHLNAVGGFMSNVSAESLKQFKLKFHQYKHDHPHRKEAQGIGLNYIDLWAAPEFGIALVVTNCNGTGMIILNNEAHQNLESILQPLIQAGNFFT
jgi:hypothetical protein